MKLTDEIKIMKLAGISHFDVMIETCRKPGESLMNDIIFIKDSFDQKKSKYPYLFKGDKTKTVNYMGKNYVVLLNNWS